MALTTCNIIIDSQGRELVQHGTFSFPIACYQDALDKDGVPWHWHEELEAAIITEGTALVAAGNTKYTIGPGDGFLINSGVLHGCWDVDSSGCRFRSLVFHPRLVGGSLDSVFYQKYMLPLSENQFLNSISFSHRIPWQQEALKSIEKAWHSCTNQPPGFEFGVRAALSELVLLVHSNLPAISHQPGLKSMRNGERIKKMLQYIHDNYANELTVGLIAQSAAISESECLRCFRATIGTTPIQYVKQYRIQKAAQLLSAPHGRISDIAAQCGFQDLSYFTKSFRDLKGCAPSEYRDRHCSEPLPPSNDHT